MISNTGLTKNNKHMKEIVSQLQYDIVQIENKIKSIENTKEKMVQWVGKPIYKGCEESIINWENEINDHKKMFFEYSNKLKNF